MENEKSKVYVFPDSTGRILYIDGGYTISNIKDIENWALIDEGYGADPAIFAGFTPTMALWGQRDPLLSANDAAQIRSSLTGAEVHVLHTAAHFPQETHSRAVGDYLRGWLKYIDG